LWLRCRQPELEKIAAVFPEARVVIRIAVDDSKSVCRFNSKFGAAPSEWGALLGLASELGLEVVGVSFHVGSGCQDSGPFGEAIASARAFIDMAEEHGFAPTLLDIGGYPIRSSRVDLVPETKRRRCTTSSHVVFHLHTNSRVCTHNSSKLAIWLRMLSYPSS
jgi:diaminopimelate decarboxylase